MEGSARAIHMSELHTVKVARLNQKVGSKFLPGQTGAERVELLKPFADCINSCMEIGMLQVWDSKGFGYIPEKQKRGMGGGKTPYHLAFVRGLEGVAEYGSIDDRISMNCDDDEETALDCYLLYRALRKPSRKVRTKVKSLAFVDSETFPAIQAADLMAYLGRKEGEFRWRDLRYDFQELLNYTTKDQKPGKMEWRAAFVDEERLKKAKDWPRL